MLDAVNSVASGVLRSLGRQYVGALINFVAYYLVGFPIALYLTYGRPHAGAFGLWYGIGAGVGLTVLMQLLIFARTNWRNEVQNCMVRVSEDNLAFANNCIEDEKKLSVRTDRIKAIDMHPTEPWVVASLYDGKVHIWNYETQAEIKTFE
ncbi:hypothetical protein GGI11_008510, partial [Coemansia sp. RSA 2049]